MKNPHFVRIQKILGPLVRFLFPITLEGAENLPDDRPVMLCDNHSSRSEERRVGKEWRSRWSQYH